MEQPMENNCGRNEFNMLDCMRIVWRRKKTVAAFLILGTLATAIVSLMTPDTYRANAVITPVSSQDGLGGSGLSTLAQQFGAIPGLSIPDSGSSAEIVSLLNSNILREKVLARDGFIRMLFPERWDAEKKEWKSAEKKAPLLNPMSLARSFFQAHESAASNAPGGAGSAGPTVWDGIRRLKERVDVTQSARDSTITISADAPTPEAAAGTVDYLLDTLNRHMSGEAQRVARINRKYLEGQLYAAADPIIRQKIYNLIARQIEVDMMSEVKENFAFKVIDPPMVPDQRVSPRRIRMIEAGFGLSFLAGVLAVFVLDFASRQVGRRGS